MSEPSEPQLTDEEIAQLEAELDRITVDDVLLQTVVSLLNLGGRKAGMGGEAPAKPDFEQLRQAIEGARSLLPLLEQRHGDKLAPVRDMLSQLQLVYARSVPGGEAPAAGQSAAPGAPDESAQRSSRLWVPGQ